MTTVKDQFGNDITVTILQDGGLSPHLVRSSFGQVLRQGWDGRFYPA